MTRLMGTELITASRAELAAGRDRLARIRASQWPPAPLLADMWVALHEVDELGPNDEDAVADALDDHRLESLNAAARAEEASSC